MSTIPPCLFIAKWNNELGSQLIQFYPSSLNFDLNLVSMKIFLTFNGLFFSEKQQDLKKVIFTLSINNIGRNARIFLDKPEPNNINNTQNLFAVVLLIPNYFSEDKLSEFDPILNKIGGAYKQSKTIDLTEFFGQIEYTYSFTQEIQDSEIKIEDNYDLNRALMDFKTAIDFFSKKKYEQSYVLIRKAHLKFESLSEKKLLIESIYFLASILANLNNFKASLRYFESLLELSLNHKHQKYIEISYYMSGFCYFKLGEYELALEKFNKLRDSKHYFIDDFTLYFLYGRILRELGKPLEAKKMLKKAAIISENIKPSDQMNKKKAKLYFEIGHVYYKLAFNAFSFQNELKESGEYMTFLEKALEQYNNSLNYWNLIKFYPGLIQTNRIIGDIFLLLNNPTASIESYQKAIDYSEISNDIFSRMSIFNLLIQNLENLSFYEEIIKKIDDMLSKIKAYAFLDLQTIAGYHFMLGKAFLKLVRYKEALSELLIALNIYNKFIVPHENETQVLKNILSIYEEMKEEKYIVYYKEQYKTALEKLDKYKVKKEEKNKVLFLFQEIWIFSDDGTPIFIYAPKSTLNPELFAGFITAIQNFSREMTTNELKSINIGFDKYSLYKRNYPVFVLGRSSTDFLDNYLEKGLALIYEAFWENYGHKYKESAIDLSTFSDFVYRLQELKY